MTIDIELLRGNPYFAGFTKIDRLRNFIFKKEVGEGGIISIESEPSKTLYFIISGMVKLFKTSADGREQILFLLSPGETFNDSSVFSDEPNIASAQAIDSVTLYGIEKVDLKRIIRNHHKIAANANLVLSRQAYMLVSLIEDLSFKPVIDRVANVIQKYTDNRLISGRRLTQQVIADMAGTAREVVGRTMKILGTKKTQGV